MFACVRPSIVRPSAQRERHAGWLQPDLLRGCARREGLLFSGVPAMGPPGEGGDIEGVNASIYLLVLSVDLLMCL